MYITKDDRQKISKVVGNFFSFKVKMFAKMTIGREMTDLFIIIQLL